jgi:hypothetical protein
VLAALGKEFKMKIVDKQIAKVAFSHSFGFALSRDTARRIAGELELHLRRQGHDCCEVSVQSPAEGKRMDVNIQWRDQWVAGAEEEALLSVLEGLQDNAGIMSLPTIRGRTEFHECLEQAKTLDASTSLVAFMKCTATAIASGLNGGLSTGQIAADLAASFSAVKGKELSSEEETYIHEVIWGEQLNAA